MLGISNHDASTRNGTIYNDSTYLNWNNDRQSVLAGTSISDTSQSSRPHCNQRQNLFSHTTENLNYGNKTGNSTSFMSPPSWNRAGSHNNNNFSAVGNRVLPNQMYNTNAYNVTHANNMKPAIQNCTEEISISERMFSSDFKASAKHTHLEGPLISRICVVDITTLSFICLKDENGEPCYNHGGYTVSVGPEQSVTIATYLADYRSYTTSYNLWNSSKNQSCA